MENKDLNAAQTSKETEQELSTLADELEEIDKAEGIFGEVITDEELDLVAGGGPPTTKQPIFSRERVDIYKYVQR